MQRQFTSGSRQAPDPFDQFLEENNYYRKHTARDSSCLFRAISEQIYDTQQHHLVIRKRCVRYMRKHSQYFQSLVDRDWSDYLDDMSKPKTYGTLIELRAVGYLFQRNVLLFRPYDLGSYYGSINNSCEFFRVFYTPERHFDSVFTCEYIKDAAICQSICYEILYKDLYKLPDVTFAVEQMLHSSSFDDNECHSECNEDGYCTRIHLADGRIFELDLPQNTCCILENYKLCHFHYINFPRFADEIQRDIKVFINHGEHHEKKAAESLPNKFISCVRQLLQEGITPFPYKVAKALDPNMYRNIEFDSWNEARKELKLQNWYNGDANFKVGAKCHVKLRKSENDLYTCHIQEIAVDKGYCIVFIEQLGEKRLVPYESLTPLPPEQFKPWTLPYRLQRHMQKYSSFRYTRHYNYQFKCNGGQFSQHDFSSAALPALKSDYYDVLAASDNEKHVYAAAHAADHHQSCSSNNSNSCYYRLKQYTHLENFRAQTLEYCTLPLTVEQQSTNRGDQDGNKMQHQQQQQRSNDTPSRATSRSSVHITEEGQQQLKQEVDDAAPTTVNGTTTPLEGYEFENSGGSGGFLPEMHCFYPVPQYAAGCGAPEEYYSYGYDASMPTLVPANAAGTIYYASYPPPPPPPSSSLYMQAAAPPAQTAGHPFIAAAAAAAAGSNAAAVGGYLPNAYYSAAAMLPPSSFIAASASVSTVGNTGTHNLTPSTRPGRGGGGANTPLSGRINWDAKKSVKSNGNDLPTDVATLRYFYNLGLDYYNKQLKQQRDAVGNFTDDAGVVDHIVKLSTEMQDMKFDENGSASESKCDINNNNNSNNVGGNGKTHSSSYQRRFSSRYFNSKERQAYQQRTASGGGGGNATASGNQSRSNNAAGMQNHHHHHQQQQQQSDYNKNNVGGKNSTSNNISNTANSRNQMQNSNSNSGPSNGGASLLRTVVEQGIQTSPMVAYNGAQHNNITDNVQTPPTIYNPNMNPFIACGGAYDFTAAEQNVPLPTHFAPPPSAGSVLIPMQMPTSAYGIYTTAPPPPHPPPTLGIHPTAGAYAAASYMSLPPTAAGTAMQLHGAPPPPPPAGQLPPQSQTTQQQQQQQQQTNGFYVGTGAGTGLECGIDNNGVAVGTVDGSGGGVQFQCMTYPPQMPIFYSPTQHSTAAGVGGNCVSNTNTPNALQNQQHSSSTSVGGLMAGPPPPSSVCQQAGYWCVSQQPPPPPTQHSMTQQANTGLGGGGGAALNSTTVANSSATGGNAGGGGAAASSAHHNNRRDNKSSSTNE